MRLRNKPSDPKKREAVLPSYESVQPLIAVYCLPWTLRPSSEDVRVPASLVELLQKFVDSSLPFVRAENVKTIYCLLDLLRINRAELACRRFSAQRR